MGSSFRDLWNDPNFLTDTERAEIELEIALIGKFVEAREQKGITQEKLAEMSGLKQSAIARLERMTSKPQIDTLIKVLTPLGYKLAIVPNEQTQQ